MQDFLAAVPYRLSGGQKQKVSLAGVIHENVQILLFDEPLASLDPAMGKTAIELIDDLYKLNQKTVIIIEHRLEDVLHRPIDRVILMDEGRIVADTTPDELLVSDLLAKYGIREPLYLSALKHAGCEVLASDGPCDVHTMNLSRFENQLKAFEEKYIASTDKQFHQKLIEVNHVSFAYDKVNVLKNVSFDIYSGEKIAIVGKNGAGKSTMAKMLCGVIRPDEGQIKVNHQNYLQMTIKELGEMIGYVMQNPNQMLVKDIIKDEVGLALKLRKMTEEQIDERVDEVLKTCNLYSMRNWPVSAVSYGQRKRITIAAIMALKPTIMLLDEPTAGQDYRHYTEILSFLEELHEKMNLTILFITHDMHLAIEYTDRAIVFADGECIRDDQVYRVLSDPDIIEHANLKQTSLYTLAHRIGRTPEALIDQFITLEREGKR
jgi:energy-coupling factor transport system ATP-binding protein